MQYVLKLRVREPKSWTLVRRIVDVERDDDWSYLNPFGHLANPELTTCDDYLRDPRHARKFATPADALCHRDAIAADFPPATWEVEVEPYPHDPHAHDMPSAPTPGPVEHFGMGILGGGRD